MTTPVICGLRPDPPTVAKAAAVAVGPGMNRVRLCCSDYAAARGMTLLA